MHDAMIARLLRDRGRHAVLPRGQIRPTTDRGTRQRPGRRMEEKGRLSTQAGRAERAAPRHVVRRASAIRAGWPN
eukprot:351227-Chlamydomonas_euryale.AAC.3